MRVYVRSLVLNGVLAAFLALAVAIGLGKWASVLDPLSAASVPVALCGIAICIGAALRRSPKYAAVGLAIGLLPTPLAAPELIGRVRQLSPSEAPAGRKIEIITFNMMDGNLEFERVAAFLRAERPDIVVLQEAREPTVQALARALPDYRTRVSCGDYPYCGLLILSRWPATLLSHGFWADNGLRGRGWGQPRLRYADLTLHVGNSVDVDIAAIHVERRGRLEFDQTQLTDLAQRGRALPNPRRAILSGDFNTAAPSHALARFDESTTLRRQSVMLPSWPSSAPVVAIDHIYAGDDLQLLRIRRGPALGSDHLPIIAEFAVR